MEAYDDFDDLLDDFFIYIHESGHTPYQALQRIKRKQAFESWLLNTFRNYLNNRSEEESHIPLVDKDCEKMSLLTESSSADGEIKIHIVSQLIAYALQVFYPRGRFIFLRLLLTILNEQQAVPDKEMAEALGMSYISYRVTLHHMRSNVKRIDTLKTSDAVKELRSQYIEERGFVVHEPSIPEYSRISIARFWVKLHRWLIPGMMAM